MSTLSRRRTHRHRRRASTLLFLSATAENRATILRLSTVSMSVCLHVSVCLSVYLHVSVCLSVYLHVSVCLSVYLHVSVCLSVYLHVSVCLSVYLHISVCLSVYHEACNVCTGSCYPENNILLLLSIFVI